jgi:hypothetical protein
MSAFLNYNLLRTRQTKLRLTSYLASLPLFLPLTRSELRQSIPNPVIRSRRFNPNNVPRGSRYSCVTHLPRPTLMDIKSFKFNPELGKIVT